MAFSKSFVKAQEFISCQLCESETKIRWKCMQCDLLMCNKCRDKIHPKFQSAKNHRIIDIKEIGLFTDKDKDIDFTNIKCKQHSDHACCIFCTTCDKPVCVTCIAKTHSKHEFLEIKEVYKMKIDRLKNCQKKLEKDKAKFMKESKDMDNSPTIYDSMQKKLLQDIQNQRKALLNKVDQYIANLTKEVDQRMKTVRDSSSNEKTKVDKIFQTLEDKIRKSENTIKSKDASVFFDVVDGLVKSMEKAVPPINILNNSKMRFVPGDISLSNFGSIQVYPNITELEVVRKFTTEISNVSRVLSREEDSLWIADFDNDILQKVKSVDVQNRITGNYTLKTLSTFNIPNVYDMSVSPSNDILLSTMESSLKLINYTMGTLADSDYSVQPLKTLAVHVTNDNIIIGAKTPGPTFPVTGTRVVIVMNKNGDYETYYEHERDKRLFTYPRSISSTSNGNIAVVDMVSGNGAGRLVILSDKGGVTIYTGHSEINTMDKQFKPRNIVTTPADFIIVTDYANSLLHILDCEGKFIQYINTLDKGIQYPFSLAYTATGHLYIGCSSPRRSAEKANMYEVVLSGC